jgi:anaerobic selenocysteine-containing dehydrogenase
MSDQIKSTTCSYCSTGCNLNIAVDEGGVVQKIRGKAEYPVNLGKACAKGLNLTEPFTSAERGTVPLIKTAGGRESAGWDEALELFCSRMKAIQAEHGEESVAFISTGQIPTEEMALLGAFAKFGMGVVHGDGNTRQCMATAVVAYKQAFGFDAPPYTYKDFEESDTLVFVGANPAVAHPIMWNRVKMNKNDPNVIVLDPRRTKTAQAATHHLPLAPQSDLTLLYTVAHLLIKRDWVDQVYIQEHTSGFEEFKTHVADYTIERGVVESGLSEEQIEELVRLIHDGKAVSFWWTMGINQSHQGVKAAQAMINIALMTGNIGRPGTGANSITGQANAMGSRLFSNTTNLLGGHDFTNEAHRRKVAAILNISEKRIPDRPSLPYHQILEQVKAGKIKALWIVATNPAHSWIDLNEFDEIMAQLDFLVVQDIYPTTATAKMADLYLPAAASAEKEGFFINSERRLGHVAKVLDPPGQALSDFDIVLRIAETWGCGRWIERWNKPEKVFQLLKKLSAGQPCDITGIRDYDHLDECGGIQWPLLAGSPLANHERRLFEDGTFYHPDGKARFLFRGSVAPVEECSADYPFWLLTGRGTVAQWHTQTRTHKAERLRRMAPEELYVEINPGDATQLGIEQGDTVTVSSARGCVNAIASVVDDVAINQIFMPMHYPETNRLTFPSFDPESFQPAFKSAAVSLKKV